MPLPQCCRIIKHSGQGLGDVLQGYGWCRSCSRGPLACPTNPISCLGAQVEPVPERFHLCGARSCWIFTLCVWEICFSSIPDLWDPESHRLQSLLNAFRVGGWCFVCSGPLLREPAWHSPPWARTAKAVPQKFGIFYFIAGLQTLFWSGEWTLGELFQQRGGLLASTASALHVRISHLYCQVPQMYLLEESDMVWLKGFIFVIQGFSLY